MAKNTLLITKRAKGEDGYRTFSIRIREELVERLDALCQESGRSRNDLIARFIEYGADNCKIK